MSIKLGRLPFASPLALCWNWTPRRDFAIATTTIEAIQAVVVQATGTAWGSNVWGNVCPTLRRLLADVIWIWMWMEWHVKIEELRG